MSQIFEFTIIKSFSKIDAENKIKGRPLPPGRREIRHLVKDKFEFDEVSMYGKGLVIYN